MRTRRANPGRVRGATRETSVRGFTLIEILLVIALVGASLAMASPILADLVQREDLGAETLLVVDALQEAQSAAMTGKGSGRFGVHFETGSVTRFEGASYSPGAPDNFVRDLSDLVSVTDVTVTGSGNDVLFENHRGTPSQTGTVTLTDVGGATRTITIGAAGLIEAD